MSNSGGDSNAWTDTTNTVYYFNIPNQNFGEALDIFSEFFKSALLDKNYVNKELNAVNSEFSKNINNDFRRAYHLLRTQSNPESPFNKFSTGNFNTLKKPDIYEHLRTFYDKEYR